MVLAHSQFINYTGAQTVERNEYGRISLHHAIRFSHLGGTITTGAGINEWPVCIAVRTWILKSASVTLNFHIQPVVSAAAGGGIGAGIAIHSIANYGDAHIHQCDGVAGLCLPAELEQKEDTQE